jgi:hypothetical protein
MMKDFVKDQEELWRLIDETRRDTITNNTTSKARTFITTKRVTTPV